MLLGVMKNREVGIAMALPAITSIPWIRLRTIGKTEARMKEVCKYSIKFEMLIFPCTDQPVHRGQCNAGSGKLQRRG